MIRLELERRKRDLTQEQLGSVVKIQGADICRIEKGFRAYPSHLKKLSECFGISGEQLLRKVK